jgi:hypothetical protein
MPLHVYMSIRIEPHNLDTAIERLEYLANKHIDTELNLAAYRRSNGRILLTLEVFMGPARAALRGTSPHLQAGYALLWDIVKTMFTYHPVLTGPPSDEERATVALMSKRPQLRRTSTSALTAVS